MLEKVNSPQDIKELSLSELQQLAQEIRDFLIENVTQTGGHLSPNLGVVELTLALHYIFDYPKDELIWDVGHQSYVHKILTGRKDRFQTLRMKDGLSGYPSPAESSYDVIHAGHSSTSLSIAAGIAKARLLNKEEGSTVAIIGDGAFSGGLVYEALNTISHDHLPVIIVLNDNGMSISQNVGGMSRYLTKLKTSNSYLHFKRSLEKLLNKRIPIVGRRLLSAFYFFKEFFKSILMKKNFFEDMGISYYGPIDGHDLKKLISTFREVKGINKPIIIHAITTKGKGYQPSEDDPGHYHGISGISINGDNTIPLEKENPGYSAIFGETLLEIAGKDDRVFALTASMKTGTGLKAFAEKFPDRFSDVGIAEEHAVDYALGLSLKGYKPVVAIYSTFLQRSFDQLIHDVGISNAKILFCIDRAGLVPGDGETHQGVFDISYLRMIPHFTVMLPACKTEFQMMLSYSLEKLNSPIAIRYPKDEAFDFQKYPARNYPIVMGEGVLVSKGKDLILVSTGSLLKEALMVRKLLQKENIDVELFNLRFAKPISNHGINYFAENSNKAVLIIEEGVFNGGISQYLSVEIQKVNPAKRVYSIALPDEFPSIGTRDELLNDYGLSALKIKNEILSILKEGNR